MTAYLVANYDVVDADAYRSYQKQSRPIMAGGGKLLVLDAASVSKEGTPGAQTVVIEGCFTLDELPASFKDVQLILSQTDPETDITTERVIPFHDANEPEAGCQSCGDCPDGAWRFDGANRICLDCGLSMDTGDVVSRKVTFHLRKVETGPGLLPGAAHSGLTVGDYRARVQQSVLRNRQ